MKDEDLLTHEDKNPREEVCGVYNAAPGRSKLQNHFEGS